MAALPTPPLNFDPQPALQQEAARFQNTPGFSDIVQLLQSLQHDQQRQIDELPRVTEELSRQFKRFTQDTMIEFSHIRARYECVYFLYPLCPLTSLQPQPHPGAII